MRRPSEWSTARYWAVGLLLGMLLTGAVGAQVVGFPIVVDNPLEIDRVDEPVATGVPLPYWLPFYNPAINFKLVDDAGNPVPSQLKVLSRWNGKRDDTSHNVKWALAMFRATVPANSSRTYYCVGGQQIDGMMTTTQSSSLVVVDTGAARFEIDRNSFSLFKQVEVGGEAVLGAAGSLDVIDTDGNPVAVVLNQVVIEEPGTVRTVVRQRGSLPSLGLKFTVRSYFWAGRTDVKVDFRLENPGNYGEVNYLGPTPQHARFEDLALTLRLGGTVANVVTSTATRDTNGSSYKLEQDFAMSTPTDMLACFSFGETLGGATVGSGGRYEGAIAATSSTGAVSVAVDRFWQNFPKALRSSGDALSIALFPSFGEGPGYTGQWGLPSGVLTNSLDADYYRFEGGRWKTHTLLFDFKPAGQSFSANEVAEQALVVSKPMMLRTPRGWPFRCFAFGELVAERRDWTQVSDIRYEQMMDVLADDSAADQQDGLGQIGLPGFRNRGGTYGGQLMYGWDNFGDVAWGDGYSSNHYDLVYGVLVNWFRTGDYAFFDQGRDMATHRRDYDQVHTTDSASVRRGGQSYEKGFFHGNFDAPQPSHTWVHGLALHYVMTGDEGTHEALLESWGFFQRMHPENWDGWWGSRILGWQLEGVMNLYNYLGNPQYLSLATATAARWAQLEIQNGATGAVPNPAWVTPHSQTWMHAIVLNALGKYYINTGDATILPCIQRMADWFVDETIVEIPNGPATARRVGKIWGRAGPNDYHQDLSVHYMWPTIQALTYAAVCLGDNDLMTLSSQFFESATRYHQVSAGDFSNKNYNDPTSYSPIAFRMMQFPNSETKIMSNIALWGQAQVAARLLWNGTWWQ